MYIIKPRPARKASGGVMFKEHRIHLAAGFVPVIDPDGNRSLLSSRTVDSPLGTAENRFCVSATFTKSGTPSTVDWCIDDNVSVNIERPTLTDGELRKHVWTFLSPAIDNQTRRLFNLSLALAYLREEATITSK